MKNSVKASVLVLAFVLTIALSPSSLAQSFKKVGVKGGAKMTQIASGGRSVWALATNGQPYIYQNNQFVLANTRSLTQIALGGGNLRQADAVWAVDSATNIYRASKSGTSWVFKQVPGNLDFIAVGIGYNDNCHPYEVWGLNPSAEIWRYDFCVKNWSQIPGSLGWMVVSGSDVWGINGNGTLYYFDYALGSFQQAMGGGALFAVGPQSVWVFDHSGITPDAVYQVTPSGNIALAVQSLSQIQAGGDGLRGIDLSGQVFELRYAAERSVQIPGIVLASIGVGSGGGVWGMDFTGQVFAFSTP